MTRGASHWDGELDARALARLLFESGSVVELRAIGARGVRGNGIVSGYFSDPDAFVKAAASLDGRAAGVYATLNPVRPELLARASNRLVEGPKHATGDGEILSRRHVLIDVDPARPAGISASNEEHEAALALLHEVLAYLRLLGFPEPLEADSGNGAHALFRVDLPCADAGLVQRFLEALAFRFDTGTTKIDTKVSNPARISKLYGTLASKGDAIEGRPHRRSQILRLPDPFLPVPRELLETVAAQAPQIEPPKAHVAGSPSGAFDVEAFLGRHGIGVLRSGPWLGGIRWSLDVCPFNAEHTNGSAYVVQFASGAVAAGCHHSSCSGKVWRDLREAFEPAAAGRARGDAAAQAAEAPGESTDDADAHEGETISAQIVRLALARGIELFHTPRQVPFVMVPADGHHETLPVRSRQFKLWLSRLFHEDTGKPAAANPLGDALNVLEAAALFSGPERSVHVRLANLDGVSYLDLADSTRTVIEIDSSGWRIATDPPVRFRRAPGMLPLPLPLRGGSLLAMRRLLNFSKGGFILFVAWLLGALRPRGPYPILDVHGEHGSGKSTTARVAKALVDPNEAPLRRPPREDRVLMIAANNSWVLSLDNLSDLAPWLSDTLASLATGSGFASRTLYSDEEETILCATRPIVMNGIEDVAELPDILDRCLRLPHPPMPDRRRMTEEDFWAQFEAMRPQVLGALLDAVSTALRNLPTVQVPQLPRMADFAKWVVAAEPALPWRKGRFLKAYEGAIGDTNQAAIEGSAIGRTVLAFARQLSTAEWEGTATDLLAILDQRAGEKVRAEKSWPRSARGLSGRLRRVAPNLRRLGVEVEFLPRGDERGVRIRRVKARKQPSGPSVPSGSACETQPSSDGRRTEGGAPTETDGQPTGGAGPIVAHPDGTDGPDGGSPRPDLEEPEGREPGAEG